MRFKLRLRDKPPFLTNTVDTSALNLNFINKILSVASSRNEPSDILLLAFSYIMPKPLVAVHEQKNKALWNKGWTTKV